MIVEDFLNSIGCNPNDTRNKFAETNSVLGVNAPQQWVNFYDKSLFAYAKGGHRVLKGIIDLSSDIKTVQITKTPVYDTQYIPITDPAYHLYGGYFSSTFTPHDDIVSPYYQTGDITVGDIVARHTANFDAEQKQKFLFDIFDQILSKINSGSMVYDEHMRGLPTRLVDAYRDCDFDINNVIILDLQRHGTGIFLQNFQHLEKWKQLELFKFASQHSFMHQHISIAFLKWYRWNSKQLMNKFNNEYCLYDYFRDISIEQIAGGQK